MKKEFSTTLILTFFLVNLGFIIFNLNDDEKLRKDLISEPIIDIQQSCTIFTVTHGNNIFFGNNEDYKLENNYLWIYPSQTVATLEIAEPIYASIFLGFDNNGNDDTDSADGYPQGGINEYGLCLDANGLPEVPLKFFPDRVYPNQYFHPFQEILFTCKTVNETIKWFQNHNLGNSMGGQLHFADATGDAVVISAGPDKDIVFTRIEQNLTGSGYLVSTNFNLADNSNGWYPCSRYSTATNMLESIMNAKNVSQEACVEILDAVHQTGTYNTIYSNVFDLVTLKLYLYYRYNFTREVVIDFKTMMEEVRSLNDTDHSTRSGAKFVENHIWNTYFEDNLEQFKENPKISGYKFFIVNFHGIIGLIIIVKLKTHNPE